MNDRYLFRGKRKDNGEWVEEFYVCLGGMFHYILKGKLNIDGNYIGFEKYEVDPETVGQYTGLKDKKGKMIFEGDIVNVNTNKDNLCHRYEGKRLVIRFDEYHRFVASGRLEYPLCNHYEWEVIGNIHDNPEC